jgi:replication factor C subunit 2/4
MKDRLLTIACAEGCGDDELALVDEILSHAGGDMRRAVTTLQSVHSLAVGGAHQLSADSIAEIAGVPPKAVVDRLWASLELAGPSASALSPFTRMERTVEGVCADGYSALILLTALLPTVIESNILTEMCKADIAIRIAEAEKNMVEGADEYLQIMTVCSLIVTCFDISRDAAANQ